MGTPPINVFEGKVENGKVIIGGAAVADAKEGIENQDVYIGIRPEGFILDENGPLELNLVRVEVMGRDTSVVSTSEHCQNATIRSIISAENVVDTSKPTVRFSVKPYKLFVFSKTTEERLQ